MPYANYTTEQVFLDNNVNAICNAIMQRLLSSFDEVDVNANVALTGSAARIMQGAIKTPIPCLSFVISSLNIYTYLRGNINYFVNVTSKQFYSDRFQVINQYVYLEFWFSENALSIVNLNDIYVENIANIPNNIL